MRKLAVLVNSSGKRVRSLGAKGLESLGSAHGLQVAQQVVHETDLHRLSLLHLLLLLADILAALTER